jgi:hypothetical protein
MLSSLLAVLLSTVAGNFFFSFGGILEHVAHSDLGGIVDNKFVMR